jgi:glycosyltransferase involved in cell wall biosynthesis
VNGPDTIVKRRVALCLEFPITQRGGVESLVAELVRGLSDFFDIILVSADETGDIMTGSWKNFVSHHVQWFAARNPEDAKSLALKLRNLKAELAHFHFGGIYSWGSRWARDCPVLHCGRLGIPCLITTHGVPSIFDYCGPHRPLWFKIGYLPLGWLSRLLVLASVEWEITVSKHAFGLMRRSFFPAAMKLRQIYHSTWRPDLPEPSEGREPFILHVGPICRHKGQLDLVNAFGTIAHRSPQWRLILVGRRAEECAVAEIGAAIERYRIKDRVEMPGEMEPESVFMLMKQSSIFALPSYSEGLPLVVQEALHYGCPVIGYATAGIPELIEHEENGLLIPRGNVRALQDGLERLIKDTHSREKFGRNARDSIERKGMNAKTMKALYRTLYEDVLSEYSRR